MIDLIPAESAHVGPLCADMRAIDRRECMALHDGPEEAMSRALSLSLWALTALEDGNPVAMLGVVPRNMIEGAGIPWMLATNRAPFLTRDLIRMAPTVIAEMRGTFTKLENFVSVENTRAIRFLRHFGWSMSEEAYDIGGVEFVRFSDV